MTAERALVGQTDISTKTDAEIRTWIENHERNGATRIPFYLMLVEEEARRRGKGLVTNVSLEHLKDAARMGRFTTYGELAKASKVSWAKARHAMNGAGGHLDQLLSICHSQGLPLLPSLCVNNEGKETGSLSEDALAGFTKGAQRLAYEISDAAKFLSDCQQECFAWGQRTREK